MDPHQFLAKWRHATLKERSAAQEHFVDLCRLLREPTPAEADPQGQWYCFEKGAQKAGGGGGWADVWKRGCFGWEYKSKGKDLQTAFKQLQLYTPALEYPPLLIVCDLERIVVHTAFTGTVPEVHVLPLDALAEPRSRQLLKWAFTEPERLRPGRTRAQVTAEAAGTLAELASALRARGHPSLAVAHFLTQCLFCLFAEDVGLLPAHLFERILEKSRPDNLGARLGELFRTMRDGGEFLLEDIAHFNGGLFAAVDPLPLQDPDLQTLRAAARLDWSAIEPAIFGTLFERGLDPAKRSQLGAHYTDPDTIRRLIDPTITAPLRAEWDAIKPRIAAALAKADAARAPATRRKHQLVAEAHFQTHLERLRQVRVLDPACGSGNFLYLALHTLHDLEHQANLEAEALGLERHLPQVGPGNLRGIELNPYAAELARLTLWIGEIQWMLGHGHGLPMKPVLQPIEAIEERDALLNPDGTEAEWPEAEVIVGNPPFLGDKKMRAELGDEYVTRLRGRYRGRVPGGADLVCYWFEKARAQIEQGQAKRAGLVATNSIRQKRNRPVLERIGETGKIYEAWSDNAWVNEGAAVRVSLVAFCDGTNGMDKKLDGKVVSEIHPDLTPGGEEGADLTTAQPLPENNGCSFFGLCLAGAFDVPGDLARTWLQQPNPHGKPNSEVLRPLRNGNDLLKTSKDRWVIDFALMEESEAALYEAPFQYVVRHIKPIRLKNNRKARADKWWRHGEARPGMRKAMAQAIRYIATVETAKHRLFVWLPVRVAPEHNLIVIPRADDTTFGLLSSRFHGLWATAAGGRLGYGNDPRYNSTRCFQPFPFPEGCTPTDTRPIAPDEAGDWAGVPFVQWDPDQQALVPGRLPYRLPPLRDPDAPIVRHWVAIARAAARLNELREAWLHPPEWVERVPEVVPGYPDRLLPKPGHEADLKKRTLTNLYNQRPAWLATAHRALDEAVAAAYGWPADLEDADLLRRLLALNQARVAG